MEERRSLDRTVVEPPTTQEPWMANPMDPDSALEALNRIADADQRDNLYEFQGAVVALGRCAAGVAHVLDDWTDAWWHWRGA